MKKLGIFLIVLSCVAGCKHDEIQVTGSNSTNTVFQTSFNQETYVWESWLFSTNRVVK